MSAPRREAAPVTNQVCRFIIFSSKGVGHAAGGAWMRAPKASVVEMR
jgi:hypothetical protein